MVSSVMGSMWYLYSGVSFNMTSSKELFNVLEEKDLQMHIEIGNDGTYNITHIGNVTFQRESSSPHTFRDVMHVLGLKKNSISVSILEDTGCDVIFNEGRDFLHHIATRQVKEIGVRVKNLYKL